ncbi:MAG: ABC transporter substrate-binding protein [Hyphomicrobium sp.]
MNTIKRLLGVVVTVIAVTTANAAFSYVEPPSLAEAVKAGTLPPVDERLPQTPYTVDLARMGREPGQHGGMLRTLMGRTQDTRMMVVYGYARLVGYTPDWEIVPDILASIDVEDERVFTLHLREGHKWSDGHPFTTADFRYYWDDVLNDPEMSPGGLPAFLMVDGQPPRFEIIDETTVRYGWDKPNASFLPALAGARPEDLYQPAHYLKQFHARYADPAELERKVAEGGQRNWVALHFSKSEQYKNENPDLPSLQPWVLTTRPPSSRFIFERNPYFHRVDAQAKQLPYIDRVALTVVNSKLIPAKAAAGDTDLQARALGFENYAVLKQGAPRHNYSVHLWQSAAGAETALYPNLNVADPVWREVVRTPEFRRALSLAIDRQEINQTIYFGMGDTGQNTVLPGSPLYRPEYAKAWTEFDLAKANALLDTAGLARRGGSSIRQLPDGRPANIVIETAGENPVEIDILQLVRDSWQKVGIKAHIKTLQRDVMRNRIATGETLIAAWKGLENALPTAKMPPHELAPVSQIQLQWPQWGMHHETHGQAGVPVDLDPARELRALYEQWRVAVEPAEQAGIWHKMLAIHADQVFSIGIVRGVPQPVVVNNTLRNVPEKAIYNWEPGAHFGMHHIDTFWFDTNTQARAD